VFLDIAWIKEKISNAPEHIKRKLPSMYHQFKELADLDITQEPMEVGPTTHYIMGGIRVNADTQESTIPGLFAAGECAAGINGANRLGGNSLSDLIVFGKRAGRIRRRRTRRPHGAAAEQTPSSGAEEPPGAVRPWQRRRNPYKVQRICRTAMQDSGGHRPRRTRRCVKRSTNLETFNAGATRRAWTATASSTRAGTRA
jgi:succinate dehydrogenase / fumarate reductase flavoprotein subunit